MTRGLLTLLLAAGTLAFPMPAHAEAGCKEVTSSTVVQGQIQVKSVRSCAGTGHQVVPTHVIPTYGDVACVAIAIQAGVDWNDYCGGEATPEVTPAAVSRALQRVALPPAHLKVQPPNGRTLVNFATNFYTERAEFTRTVRLLGQRVRLRITPSQFTWHFDDGETATTTSPGAPYPRLEVTHDYLRKGGVSPRVDTTYTAVFRVGGGAWRPVPGSVTIPGTAVDLDVVEASPVLVGYN